MRRYASPHGRGWETDHGAGMVPDEAEERTRLACHRSRARRVYGVACGRRSRHEPLRAPGRTRSGDLPLTRRTLCRLSYRGGCRKPPAVRRRPPRTRHMGPDREAGMPSSGPRGAPFPRRGPARTRRPDPAGTGPPLRAPWRGRTSVYGFGDRRAAAVPMARSCFRSSVFNHAMPAVSAAAWHGMRPRTAGRRNAFRRPSGFGRLRSAGPPGFHRSLSVQWDWPDSESNRLSLRYCVQAKTRHGLEGAATVDPPGRKQADSGGGRTRTSGVSLSQSYSLLPSPLGHATGASLLPVTVRCVPCPVHLCPQTVGLHKLMGDGSGSWSCRESNSGLACHQPLLAVTCVSDA